MRFCDLGPLQVEIDGDYVAPRGRRLSAILGTLLLHVYRRVPVDLLLDAVWAEEVTAASSSTLETHIWRLRRMLEPNRARGEASNVLLNDSGGYRLIATSGAGRLGALRAAESGCARSADHRSAGPRLAGRGPGPGAVAR